MLWNLLIEFKEMEKKNGLSFISLVKDLGFKFLIFPIIDILLIILSLYINNIIFSIIGVVLIWISTFIWVKYGTSLIDKQYGPSIHRYTYRLNIFRITLQKLNLYSSKKIEHLIKLAKDRKNIFKFNYEIFKPFVILSSILIPIANPILKWIIDNTKTTNEILVYIKLIILIALALLFTLYILRSLAKTILDRKYNSYEDLQYLLEDIYLMDFTKDTKKIIL